MKKNRQEEPLIVECAWEVCNQVGGIYTVIRSKVVAAVERWGDNYCLLGPLVDPDVSAEFDDITDSDDAVGRTVDKMRNMGFEVRYGRWLVTGKPRVVLLNPENVFNRTESLYRKLKTDHGINAKTGDDLVETLVQWADLNRTFFQILAKELGRRQAVAHFHEWMAALPILEIAQRKLPIATVFTTHATMLGRYLAGADSEFYAKIETFDPEPEAKRYGIHTQWSIESKCAEMADVFTTVSEVTGAECEHLLGKKPDLITPNGLNITRYSAFHEIQNRHEFYKDKIHEFVVGHFFNSYHFDLDKTLYFFTSGRYEWRNKGFDITLEALKWLNAKMINEGIDITVVMFFVTKRPTWSINPDVLESRGVMQEIKRNCEAIERQVGERLFRAATASEDYRLPDLNDLIDEYWKLRYRRTIQSWKTKTWPIIVTHNLVDDINDEILQTLRKEQLINSPLDKVKVVYHPDFIESINPLFGMDYGQFVRGCHLGIFPSYYEPWGYTPLECVARGVPAVTSDLSGFGRFVAELDESHEDRGVYVLERKNKTRKKIVESLGRYLLHFVKTNRRFRMQQRNLLEDFSENFDWKILVEEYRRAYDEALEKVAVRRG